MKEDPRYLRNQSRYLHRLHRRNARMLRWALRLWLLAMGAFALAAAVDATFDLGWGLEPAHVGVGILSMVAGCALWVLATFISHLTLEMARRLYGPDPGGPIES